MVRVNNVLTMIFGATSIQNTEFCQIDFGGQDADEDVVRDKFFVGVRKTLLSIRESVVELKRQVAINAFSRNCFVAMWFDASLEETYQVGIYTPLKNLGYNPIRIDKKEHNDRIDQQIFDEIRKSRFVVSDITGHRGGVYYEAGFASGLGLPVIQTCKEADFNNRHFDVFTINTIVYNTNEELAARLRQRVMETIG